MSYKIANVKVSVKTLSLSLDIVYQCASLKGLTCKNYTNFLVIKKKFTYIIFKTNKNNENHINITKIPNVSFVQEAIDLIKNLTNCFITSTHIDNIIATTNSNRELNLEQIVKEKKFDQIKYNNEKFPGLFVKFVIGTAILFHSGKIVIVGCKSEESIKCLIKKIYANI
jgi:TATA-box binding protein (TBP) (component of TFIID and TFIIIB)